MKFWGLSAIATGVRLLPLSATLLLAAVGVPKLFPHTSPRRVAQFGFLAPLAGIAIMVASLDAVAGAGAEPEIVTWPMLLAPATGTDGRLRVRTVDRRGSRRDHSIDQ